MCAEFFIVEETKVVKNTVEQQHRQWNSNVAADQVSVHWTSIGHPIHIQLTIYTKL